MNPLWGVLSWTPTNDKAVCYTIFSGNLVGCVSGNSLSFDAHKFQFVDEIKLLADGIEIDLNSISEKLSKLKICISDWIDKQPHIKRVGGKTMVLSYQAIKSPAAAC